MSDRTQLVLCFLFLGSFTAWMLYSITVYPFGKPELVQACTTLTAQGEDADGFPIMICLDPEPTCQAYTKSYPLSYCN